MGLSGSLDLYGHPGGVLIAVKSLFETLFGFFDPKGASGNSVIIFKMISGNILFNYDVKSCIFMGF